MGGCRYWVLMWVGALVACNAGSAGSDGSALSSGSPDALGEADPAATAPTPTTPTATGPRGEPSTVPDSTPPDATPPTTPAPPGPNDPTKVVRVRAQVAEDGYVIFTAPRSTSVTELTTTLTVPAKAKKSGVLFLWPGLQPRDGGANYEPIDNGVLQPVLTFGRSCAPGRQPPEYSSWWVSGQYVNTDTNDPKYAGCRGGEIMVAEVGDPLRMQIIRQGSQWLQTVTNQRTKANVSFAIDMGGQAQHLVMFSIEPVDSAMPTADVVFTDTVFAFADASAAACSTVLRGPRDYVGTVKVSQDGRRCSVDKIVMRTNDVPATDPAQPGP